MPKFLAVLSVVGTAAMIWVGGGIVLHGLEEFGLGGPAHFVHDLAHAAAEAAPAAKAAVEWLVGAAGAGVFGLALGLAIIPLATRVIAPVWRGLAGLRG
jgi:predicted DNA repair protein MutK